LLAAARRRGVHPRGSGRRGGVLSAPVAQYSARPSHGDPTPGRSRPRGGDRCGRARRLRGEWPDFAGGGRAHGDAARPRGAAPPTRGAVLALARARRAAGRLVDARTGLASQVTVLMRHWEMKLLALVFAFALW